MPTYKLQSNEIYLNLNIKKHNSETNYYYFEKFLESYSYESIEYNINYKPNLLYPNKSQEGFKEIFNNLHQYCQDKGIPLKKMTNKLKRISTLYRTYKVEKYNYGFHVDYNNTIDQSKFRELAFDPAILNDPSLISMVCLPRLEYIGGDGTRNYIPKFRKENPDFIEVKSDFFDWFRVIPPITHPDRIKKCPYSDEIVLAAPYFKKQVLPSGSILLQMTEKTDFTKFDQMYWDRLMELYQYFITKETLE
jgi:hypothetical protein